MDITNFNAKGLTGLAPEIFQTPRRCNTLDELRTGLTELLVRIEIEAGQRAVNQPSAVMARIRDCGQVLRNMIKERSDQLAGFSLIQVIDDLANDRERPELSTAFYADLFHIIEGLKGQGSGKIVEDLYPSPPENLSGRDAAIERSNHLDRLRAEADRRMAGYADGLSEEAISRRQTRRAFICRILGASENEWQDWRWQVNNVVRDQGLLERLVSLDERQKAGVKAARQHSLPFGITPYYLSLMDQEKSGRRDAAIRAQVLPPVDYAHHIAAAAENNTSLDYMGEEDTSPADLITRRYPAICILKPFNTCPQICVYCQRNWEIDDAMARGAFAGMDQIDAAINWIREHPGIHEVLVTGGDPLAMGDGAIEEILAKLAEIPSIDRIRIGTRTLVTMPMRITGQLVEIIGRHRMPGRREIAIVTHIQHPYEITPELLAAVNLLRMRGMAVYNQLVYTFYTSRRFEASALRRLLRLSGVDPYYTFNTKGKDETESYRVPVARLVQEQQEEARLMPGLERSDEAIFNLPRLGKNYLKSREHRDLISILPNGSRVHEFFPWEKNTSSVSTYCAPDVPIFNYLERLSRVGENIADYDSIWYYF